MKSCKNPFFLLTMDMTALGAETSIDKFRQAGAKPFYPAGIICLWLIFGGYALCQFLPCFHKMAIPMNLSPYTMVISMK